MKTPKRRYPVLGDLLRRRLTGEILTANFAQRHEAQRATQNQLGVRLLVAMWAPHSPPYDKPWMWRMMPALEVEVTPTSPFIRLPFGGTSDVTLSEEAKTALVSGLPPHFPVAWNNDRILLLPVPGSSMLNTNWIELMPDGPAIIDSLRAFHTAALNLHREQQLAGRRLADFIDQFKSVPRLLEACPDMQFYVDSILGTPHAESTPKPSAELLQLVKKD